MIRYETHSFCSGRPCSFMCIAPKWREQVFYTSLQPPRHTFPTIIASIRLSQLAPHHTGGGGIAKRSTIIRMRGGWPRTASWNSLGAWWLGEWCRPEVFPFSWVFCSFFIFSAPPATHPRPTHEPPANMSMIFREIGLHKPEFDETWYAKIYVTRWITACYSRYNAIFEK